MFGIIFTLYGVSLPRIGDTIRVEEAVFSLKHICHHLFHCALVELLLCGLWPKDLQQIGGEKPSVGFFKQLIWTKAKCYCYSFQPVSLYVLLKDGPLALVDMSITSNTLAFNKMHEHDTTFEKLNLCMLWVIPLSAVLMFWDSFGALSRSVSSSWTATQPLIKEEWNLSTGVIETIDVHCRPTES